MIDIYALVQDGFMIKEGELYDRFGHSKYVKIQKRAFCTDEYVFDNYDLHEYTIQKRGWGGYWYLLRGYNEVCELIHLGGMNFKTRNL